MAVDGTLLGISAGVTTEHYPMLTLVPNRSEVGVHLIIAREPADHLSAGSALIPDPEVRIPECEWSHCSLTKLSRTTKDTPINNCYYFGSDLGLMV